jgi:hypothetical protein
MECGICYEEQIQEHNMEFMICLHTICKNCFDKLLTNTCPFCRQIIYINNNIDIINDYEIIVENDFIIPTIRRDRQECKRKKRNKKMEHLENIVNENIINNIFPNDKKRYNKKSKNLIFKV